jgi:predicted RND superfamily exporter protein
VKIETIVNPNSDAIAKFVEQVRKQCSSTNYVVQGSPVNLYLFGGYTTTLDVQNALYKLVPVMIAVTLVVVVLLIAVSFGSIILAIRLLFTIFISLAWTYGFMVIIFTKADYNGHKYLLSLF